MIHTRYDGTALSSSLFSEFPWIRHGFTTRRNDTMRDEKNREIFLKVPARDIVSLKQVHGHDVVWIGPEKHDDILIADAVCTDESVSSAVLTIRVGDCVPLLFLDPISRCIGVAHAGWKGTSEYIAQKVIHEFTVHGAKVSDIRVAIGPHIGGCCYAVSPERAELFASIYNADKRVVYTEGTTSYVDIGYANYVTLLQCGIVPAHIDWYLGCTHCQSDLFFSYRRKDDTYGEMMGYIGYAKE